MNAYPLLASILLVGGVALLSVILLLVLRGQPLRYTLGISAASVLMGVGLLLVGDIAGAGLLGLSMGLPVGVMSVQERDAAASRVSSVKS